MSLAEQFIEEGRREGRQEGEILTLRASILEVLEIRFDRVPVGLMDEIIGLKSETKLRELHRLAVKCADAEQFAAGL